MPPRLRSAARKKEEEEEEEGGGQQEGGALLPRLLGKAAALYTAYEPLGWRLLPWLLVIVDALLSVLIVKRVPYTEIDWVAYMQEVGGFLEEGETDYVNLRGDTGPLVYPGGFVWLFSALYYATDKGRDVRLAQWIFVGLYLATLALVLLIYRKARLAPLWALPCLILSKRVHSIFMLRMFNDGVAMLLLYLALLLLMHRKYAPGCVAYSLAVSVKMNVLLFAPALALVLVQALGYPAAVAHILLCAAVQLVVAYPFLYDHPVSYLSKAFELSRVFEYQWTVNFHFLSEQAFLSKRLALLLLAGTALALLLFLRKWLAAAPAPALSATKTTTAKNPFPLLLPQRLTPVPAAAGKNNNNNGTTLSPRYVALALLTANFIGIAFARTLHYQFYSWYFHALPALAFHAIPPLFAPPAPAATKSSTPSWPLLLSALSKTLLPLLPVIGVEYAFNVFPATPLSSLVLQACHLSLLLALYLSPAPSPLAKDGDVDGSGKKKRR